MACTKNNLPAGDMKRPYMMASTRETVDLHVRNQPEINKAYAMFAYNSAWATIEKGDLLHIGVKVIRAAD